jgi:beta-ribofuranosylaminobenzene 5'-phosphate synthase
VSLSSATQAAVRISAPARLHLGFLDLNGDIGRRFGSIGLAIDQPATEITVERAETSSATGPEADRVLKLIRRFAVPPFSSGFRVTVARAIPAHAGLGSGTQLALAVGSGIFHLEGRPVNAALLADLGARGARSGIGLAGFTTGGFIVDGGRGAADTPPPVTLHAAFPEPWRILLIFDPARAGVSGEAETTAFAGLPEFPEAKAARICHLVLMKLVPGLNERNIKDFGSAITEIQAILGGHFASKQGGSAWTSAAVGRLAMRMAELGATGIGQSSWGPTGFAFVDSQKAAERLYHSLVEEAKRDGLDIAIARGRNAGARIEMV